MTSPLYNSDFMVQRKQAFLKQERYAVKINASRFVKWVVIAVHEEWCDLYITDRFGRIHDCYIVEVTKSYSCRKLLEDFEHRTSTICLRCYVI